MQEVGHDKTCRAEGRITRGYGASYSSQDDKSSDYRAEGLGGYQVDKYGSVALVGGNCLVQTINTTQNAMAMAAQMSAMMLSAIIAP